MIFLEATVIESQTGPASVSYELVIGSARGRADQHTIELSREDALVFAAAGEVDNARLRRQREIAAMKRQRDPNDDLPDM